MISAELFQKRIRAYQKRLLRYLRYLLNDHFMIVVFFLFGFVLVQYSAWVQTIRVLETPLLLLLSFVLALVPFVGRVATFVEPADAHFLSVIGEDFSGYYRRARVHSWGMPAVVSVFAVGVVMPIFAQAYGSIVLPFVGLLGVLLVLKGLYFRMQQWRIEGRLHLAWWHLLALYVVSVGSLFLAMTVITTGMVLVVVLVLAALLVGASIAMAARPARYQWDLLTNLETERQQRLFRVIALFVDVPMVQKSRAHRRIWLDPLVAWLSPKALHPYRYVLARSVVRSANYLPLLVQMMLLTVIVALVSPMWYWTFVVNSLVLLLICFQFASLYPQTKEQLLYVQKLFQPSEMLDDFVGVVYQLVAIALVVMTILSAAVTGQYFLLAGFLLYPVVVVAFVEMYLKPRLKKPKKRVRR